jgi:D-3-phosphoglycerate dehydrogenase
MKPRIACNFFPFHVKEARRILEEFFHVDYVQWDHEEIVKHIGNYEAFLSSLVIVDKEVYEAAPNLKVVVTPSTGTDYIDIKSAEGMGIAVLSLKYETEYLKKITSTVEQALALLLSAVRMIPSAFEAAKKSEWNSANFRGHSLSKKTLGIIGFGRLGSMMARYGNALFMKVIAVDPHKDIDVDYVEQVSLEELLNRADIISIHVHLNEETRNMIGRQRLKK